MTTRPTIDRMLAARLAPAAADWLERARAEVAAGCDVHRFCGLLSQASRHARGELLEPTADERAEAAQALSGWDPERWTLLETVRVALILARPDLADPAGAAAVEEAFRYADVGELCALYRSLAHLPEPERFVWRAGEGARSNMLVVFEATCCDSPFAARWFDDVAWRQAVVKCLFVEAPLWRIPGLDDRIDAELARMALDLADERSSAGRRVWPQLFLCLLDVGGERGGTWIERLLAEGDSGQRRAAALALGRAGELDRLRSLAAVEEDPDVKATMDRALGGHTDPTAFENFDPEADASRT